MSTIRGRNRYAPSASEAFELSRSRLESFVKCPRCFYLDRRLGIEPPRSPPYTLNNAVDELLKKEFDLYRAKKQPHPLMKQHGIEAVPYAHPALDDWRNNKKGIRHHHRKTNLVVFGAIDDVWAKPDGELIIADYKCTSTAGEITLDDAWKNAYKRQIEVYQWLFRMNGFKVSATGYFVYCNARKQEAGFSGCLKFETVVIPYEGDTGWVEDALVEAQRCLAGDSLPEPAEECDYCDYRALAADAEDP